MARKGSTDFAIFEHQDVGTYACSLQQRHSHSPRQEQVFGPICGAHRCRWFNEGEKLKAQKICVFHVNHPKRESLEERRIERRTASKLVEQAPLPSAKEELYH
jgi:uncharacterized protein YodC (DUF2158 family)